MTVATNPDHPVHTPRPELMVHAEYYHRFMLGVKWASIHLVALIAFLTLWFCTSAGFGWALLVGVVLFGAGVYAMNHGLNHTSEVETTDQS